MAQVVRAGIGAGADAALFPGANSIITSLFDLARELYASREMCEDLIKSVSDLEGPIKAMLARGNVSITEHAIKLYEKLLIDMRDYLRDHLRGSKATRLAKHWDMKDRVKQFYAERDTIVAVLNVEFIDESTSNQVEIKTLIKEVADRNERIEKQHQQGLETLERLIKEIVLTTAAQIEDAVAKAALADLKNEIKNNSAAYSVSELKIMKQVFLTGCDSSNIPRDKLSLPHWYISRSDVHSRGGNLFASGQNHNLHYGVLKDSGASVVVNLVNAGPRDERSRERFVKEVGIASLLRDPHVLPFYGANHVGSPLMYVTAHAKGGDFRSYLKANPHRFWQLFLDAARGVAYLHKNKVVHANLKCSNLLVMGDGTGVVSDFMFAFVRASSVLSLKTQPPTYDWTAPECLELDANPRFESDIYSLGMCLVEAVTGKRPYEDQTDNDDQTRAMIHAGKLPNWAVYDKIPGEVTELVEKMCATDYNARPNLRQVIEIFEALAAKEKVTYEMLSSTPDNE